MMKQTLLILFAMFSLTVFAQEKELPKDTKDETTIEKEGGPIMTFESTTVDFGTLDKGGDPIRYANFTNTGTEPLIIKHAKGSCGCTVPKWPKEPIMPGESGKMEIRYDTKRVGAIRKTVKVTTNEGGDPHVLQIVGKINAPAPKEALPKKTDAITGPDGKDGGK